MEMMQTPAMGAPWVIAGAAACWARAAGAATRVAAAAQSAVAKDLKVMMS